VLKDIHDGHVICGAFDLVLENMEMNFSDWQWKAFLELIKSLISCFTRYKLLFYFIFILFVFIYVFFS